MNLKDLVKKVNLDFSSMTLKPDAGTSLDYDFEITPENFLTFAETDFKKDNKHGHVNALSNAKRAIDCQTDKVLACFGISYKKKPFPEKQDILSKIGIIAPRILRKVVNKRNELEHRYKCPNKSEIEDAIDIAALFIDATNRTLNSFLECFSLEDKRAKGFGQLAYCLYFDFEVDEKLFEIRGFTDKHVGTIKIKPDHKAYLPIIQMAIALDKNKPVSEHIKSFFDIAKC
jgi:hypothetical protein